jgi:hypothetical protein
MSLISTLLGNNSRKVRHSARRGFGQSTVQLAVEPLEDRRVMSVSTINGGSVLPNVEVESVYYGSAWNQNPALQQQRQELDHYLKVMTDSTYMDMLNQYGVYRGSFTGDYSTVENVSGSTVTDAQVQQMLDWEIRSTPSGASLVAPDANRLYIVYTPPNVEIKDAAGDTSGFEPLVKPLTHMFGYHGSFYDPGVGTINYAVVADPAGNQQISGLTAFQQKTEVTSHELAESVTDADTVNGFRDRSGNAITNSTYLEEIGDLVNLQYANYQGYIVQKEYSNADNTGIMPDSYSLQSGNLYFVSGKTGAQTFIDSNVQSYVWDTGSWALHTVDYLTTNGQVKVTNGSAPISLTGGNTKATALTRYNGSLYMVAANNGGQSYVWRYSGPGTNWTPLTGVNTKATGLVATDSGLFMLANNNYGNGPQQVWQFNTATNSWGNPVTPPGMSGWQIVSAYGQLFMMASLNGGVIQTWQYTGYGTQWTALTGGTHVQQLAGANDALYMLGANGPHNQVWQYNGVPMSWNPLTDGSTSPSNISVDDTGKLSWF